MKKKENIWSKLLRSKAKVTAPASNGMVAESRSNCHNPAPVVPVNAASPSRPHRSNAKKVAPAVDIPVVQNAENATEIAPSPTTSTRIKSGKNPKDLPIIKSVVSLRTRSRSKSVGGEETMDTSLDLEEKQLESPTPSERSEISCLSSATTVSTSRGTRKAAVTAKKRIITKELDLTSSEDEDDEEVSSLMDKMDNSSSSLETEEDDPRAQSPNVPVDQYEIEDVLDYVRDNHGEMYFIKWKKWEPEFNTWEPPGNLVNCDDALLNFYYTRKAEVEEALANSEYVEIGGGKRRRRGPFLLDVPPDPRPFEVRVQEFCDITQSISEDEIMKLYPEWNKKFILSKGKDRGVKWPIAKVNKFLQDGVDGKLDKIEMRDLRCELLSIEMSKRRSMLSEKLKEWQGKINFMTQEMPFIAVENEVDFEGPPEGFEFVNDYVPSAGITIPSDPPVGCSCLQSCYDNRNACCAQQFGSQFAYTKYRKVALEVGRPIYECNRKCKCGPDCPNRVVQDGKVDLKLCIFRTNNGRGWGVKTMKSIKRGCFVTLYVGEVIYNEEAEERAKKKGDGHTYLFDLDFNDQDNPMYSVDASKFGNVAHFINHSCEPNLGVYAVWVDCLDPNLPKLAMFALRDIAKGEELSFDYTDQLPSESNKTLPGDQTGESEDVLSGSTKEPKERQKCLCGTNKCRKFLF